MISSQGALRIARLGYQWINSGQWYSKWHRLWKSVEIPRPILSEVNRSWSVPDAEIDAAIDALEMRLLVGRVRACSGCAGDYEDPDRSIWRLPAEEPDLAEDDASAESPDED